MIKDKALKLVNELIAENKAFKAALAQPTSGDYALGYAEGFNDACKPKPAQPAQEPVVLPCCGYTDASAVKWNSFNSVVQCHNCGQTYTTPQQRPWVGLTEEDREKFDEDQLGWNDLLTAADALLKEKNNGTPS